MNKKTMEINFETIGKNLVDSLIDLKPREQMIILVRYGLYDGSKHTLQSTGKLFNITKERIRQIEVKAFNKLEYSKQLEVFFWGNHPYRCLCGKYKTKRYLGIVCDHCGIEVQRARDIREKLIELQKTKLEVVYH